MLPPSPQSFILSGLFWYVASLGITFVTCRLLFYFLLYMLIAAGLYAGVVSLVWATARGIDTLRRQ